MSGTASRRRRTAVRGGRWAPQAREGIPKQNGRGAAAFVAVGGLEQSSALDRRLREVAALQFAADAIVGVEADGTIGSWNDGAERIFGFSRAEILGQPAAVLARPGGAAGVQRILARALAGEHIERIESDYLNKAGALLTIHSVLAPISDGNGALLGVAAIIRDITAQRSAEAELQASEHRYRSVVHALHDAIHMVDSTGSTLDFNESAMRIIGLQAEHVQVATLRDLQHRYLSEDGNEIGPGELPSEIVLRTGEAIAGSVLGIERTDGETHWVEVNCAPLFHDGAEAPYGAVSSFKDITPYKQALGELGSARVEDLRRLALVSEYRDDETSRHTERVARTAQLLAQALGMDGHFVWRIGRAAPLHDVGKVGIPDNILLKPGRLTAEEFTVMKTHTSIGARILGESDYQILQLGVEIAITHHERWDGGGYPNGLRGEEIPIAGRIVSVADAFDAMTHDRPYKRAVAPEDALAELVRCSGTQFDPDIVEAFLTLDAHSLVDRR